MYEMSERAHTQSPFFMLYIFLDLKIAIVYSFSFIRITNFSSVRGIPPRIELKAISTMSFYKGIGHD